MEVTEFINTRTVDALKKKELRECAEKCAKARVIILEDFYPQLHRLKHPQGDKSGAALACLRRLQDLRPYTHGQAGRRPAKLHETTENYDFVSVSSETIRGIYAEAFAIPAANKVKAPRRTADRRPVRLAVQEAETGGTLQKNTRFCGNRKSSFSPRLSGETVTRTPYYPEDAFQLEAFLEQMPEDTACIVKQHPFVHQPLSIPPKWQNRALDLTGKDHINDLLLITDLLITDYSSSIFEASLLEVPMLFYAFDEDRIHGQPGLLLRL